MEPVRVETGNFVQKPRIRGADFWGTLDSLVQVMHPKFHIPCYDMYFYNPEKPREDTISNLPILSSVLGKVPLLDKVQQPIPKFVLEYAMMNVDPIKFYQGTAAFELPISYSGEISDIRQDAGICPECGSRIYSGMIYLLQQKEAKIVALENKLYGLQEDYFTSNKDLIEKQKRERSLRNMISQGGDQATPYVPESPMLGPEGDYGQ